MGVNSVGSGEGDANVWGLMVKLVLATRSL